MVSKEIISSQSLQEAFMRFLSEIGNWIDDCIDELSDSLPIDGHDQGSFTIGWNPYIIAEENKRALQFLKDLRDKIKKYFESKGKWKHGYWKMSEAHHGTEHFELFLGNLWKLDHKDDETVAQMIDVAEHMGNWVEEIPDWFSWEKELFYAFHFGTDGVDLEEKKEGINNPNHFRCVNICLYAYQMTSEKRYLNLAVRHAERWTDAIINSLQLPIGLKDNGAIYSTGEEENYDNIDWLSPELASKVDRVENLMVSSSVDSLLKLWKITGKYKLRLAAETILDIVSTQVIDPEAGCGVDLIRKYRNQTGNYRYDRIILDTVESLSPYSFSKISIEPEVKRKEPLSKISGHTFGIGRRSDKPYWYEDGERAKNNPILLSLAAEIKNDEQLAIRALDIARTCFELAREVYPHGHRHGCGSRSVSAVARGNGRENNSGVVTAVLEPLMEKFF